MPSANGSSPIRVLLAKTALDGHWRGLYVVARALREAGFDVIMLGTATAEEIAAATLQEDPDVVGLNVGGHIAVAERVVQAIRDHGLDTPVVAGGTIPPSAVRRLEALGVPCFPPGSTLEDIVDTVRSAATSGMRDGS